VVLAVEFHKHAVDHLQSDFSPDHDSTITTLYVPVYHTI